MVFVTSSCSNTKNRYAKEDYEKGKKCFDLKKYANAINFFTLAIINNPNYFEAYNLRGVAFLLQGQYKYAIKDFNDAIYINPKSVVVYCNRGLAYYKKGDYKKALNDFDIAIELELDPKKLPGFRKYTQKYIDEIKRGRQDYELWIVTNCKGKVEKNNLISRFQTKNNWSKEKYIKYYKSWYRQMKKMGLNVIEPELRNKLKFYDFNGKEWEEL